MDIGVGQRAVRGSGHCVRQIRASRGVFDRYIHCTVGHIRAAAVRYVSAANRYLGVLRGECQPVGVDRPFGCEGEVLIRHGLRHVVRRAVMQPAVEGVLCGIGGHLVSRR